MSVVGWNIMGFDLKYMLKKSYLLGIEIPFDIRPTQFRNRLYFHKEFIDLMPLAGAGEWPYFASLENTAKDLGWKGGKPAEGKDFYKLCRADQEEYLATDVAMTRFVHAKINKVIGYTPACLVFDIETAPKELDEIERIAGPFNPESVKIPKTWKDPFKIQQKIDEAEMNYLRDLKEKAGLNPKYSDIIAIGYCDGEKQDLHFANETELLTQFWERSNDYITNIGEISI